jgi:hypothetical protein
MRAIGQHALMRVRVVGLGAICDLGSDDRGRPSREHSFSVSEFALTDDGRRVTLHEERGWGGRLSTDEDIWNYTTEDEVKETTFAVVRFADDGPDDHPWEWLVELCHAQGIDVTVEELQAVPYEVVLSDRVIERLSSTDHT